jgi:hypothetical protein
MITTDSSRYVRRIGHDHGQPLSPPDCGRGPRDLACLLSPVVVPAVYLPAMIITVSLVRHPAGAAQPRHSAG